MPLTEKGNEIMGAMRKTYPTEEKAKEVFYASRNAGTITGVDSRLDALVAKCDAFDKKATPAEYNRWAGGFKTLKREPGGKGIAGCTCGSPTNERAYHAVSCALNKVQRGGK